MTEEKSPLKKAIEKARYPNPVKDIKALREIKCKFCDWKISRFYTNKKGKVKYGYRDLLYHVEFQHPEEFAKIQKKLNLIDSINESM